tara:strand:+ start:170 stop:1819 length:1650 start_codon:yes stop_codon:yes gene_type:complete
MAADSTLVNAAFKLGQTEAGANVPNMAPLMQAQVGISAGFTKMARDAMGNHQKKKEIQRVGKSKQLGGFEKVFSDTLTKLYEQEEPLPDEFIDAVTNRVEKRQEEFELYNTYGKGDTSENNRARARIMGELKRVTNEVVNFRGGLEKFAIDRENGLLNEGECAESDIASSQQAIDMRNFSKNAAAGKVEVGYGEDGRLQITSRNYNYSAGSWVEDPDNPGKMIKAGASTWGDDVIVNIESLEKAFPTKNLKQDAGYLASFTESYTSGKTDGLKPNAVNNYDGEQRHAEFKATLNTDAAFQNIVSRKIEGAGGNNASFKDALLSDINIPLSILDTMFYDDNGERVEVGLLFKDLDLDGVDGITQKDHDLAEKMGGEAFETFETNLDAMIDVITNVNNPAFDRERSAGMVADYLTSMDQEKYNTGFNVAIKSKENTTGRDGLTLSYGYRTFGQMQRDYDTIKSGKEGDTMNAYYNGDVRTFVRKGNGDWAYTHVDGELTRTPEQMRQLKELTHLDVIESQEGGNVIESQGAGKYYWNGGVMMEIFKSKKAN